MNFQCLQSAFIDNELIIIMSIEYIYIISSYIGSFLFLLGIYISAFFHHLYHKIIGKKIIIHDLESFPYSQKKAYPENKLIITDDLSYYANLLGLKLDTFEIITEDGFYITLNHLYKSTGEDTKDKYPILLLHGLMQSSASFLTSGTKSIAYHLIMNNYDVWLGNNRCGFNPKHVKYNSNNYQMWNWDLIDMSKYDLPSLIDYVMLNNNYKTLSIMSHSQSTSQCVLLFANDFRDNNNNDKYNKIIDKCVLFAPAIYGGSLLNEKLFIKFIRLIPDWLYKLFFGINSFMPILVQLRNLTYKLKGFGFSSYIVFNYLFDWDDQLWDDEIRTIHFLFSPVYVSNKLMKWWLRDKNGFGNGKSIINRDGYWFNENCPKLLLIIGGNDKLVNGDLFINRLKYNEPNMLDNWQFIKINEYSHLDVLWADNIIDKIGDKLLNFLKS